jgi:hypothetical protein
VEGGGIMAKPKKTISFTVDEVDYKKIFNYAKVKGHGGQHPTSSFAHYALHQYMKKYPLSGAELEEIATNEGYAY